MVDYSVKIIKAVDPICIKIHDPFCIKIENIIKWCEEHYGLGEQYGRWWLSIVDTDTSSPEEFSSSYNSYQIHVYFTDLSDATLFKLRWM